MKILVAGGTGWIGRALVAELKSSGHEICILTRGPLSSNKDLTWTQLEEEGLPECDAIYHVAGHNILDIRERWTPSFERKIRESRIGTTEALVRAIIQQRPNRVQALRNLKMQTIESSGTSTRTTVHFQSDKMNPLVYIGISGINYYANAEETHPDAPHLAPLCDETCPAGTSVMSRLCVDWENASLPLDNLGIRRVILRSGVVLGKHGGILQQLHMPFWFGMGGPLSRGQQYLPWIHMEDLVGIFRMALEDDKIQGPMNAVAPQLARNRDFTQALGRVLHRPAVIPLPSFVVRALFGKQRSHLLLGGPKAIPKKAQDARYPFRYSDVFKACQQVMTSQ